MVSTDMARGTALQSGADCKPEKIRSETADLLGGGGNFYLHVMPMTEQAGGEPGAGFS
jgi:hypothetical protein